MLPSSHNAQDPNSSFATDAEKVATDAGEYNKLWTELRSLNDRLLRDLPHYERTHGERFVYKGEDYLSVMREDAQRIALYATPPSAARSVTRMSRCVKLPK